MMVGVFSLFLSVFLLLISWIGYLGRIRSATPFTLWFNRGLSNYNSGRYEEAIECFNTAIQIKPKDLRSWDYKGESFHNLGRYEEAIECYNTAIGIDRNYPDYWADKGTTLGVLGRYEEAIECYNKFIGLGPNYDDAYMSMFHLYAGIMSDKLGKHKNAIGYYKRALYLDSDVIDKANLDSTIKINLN